jgi:putative redox protein
MAHETKTSAKPTMSVVTVQGDASSFAQRIKTGPYELYVDEPWEVGGTATGPSPYDLLLAALGACTSMTISLYARRKNWPLRQVFIKLTHSKVHAADCRDCITQEGFLDQIDKKVYLEGDLTAEQHARLLEIGNKCPVHRTLLSEVVIHSERA